jgi:hypothetical protein
MNEYITLAVYTGMLFAIFIGGLGWNRYRKEIKRRLHLTDYRRSDGHNPV